MVIYSYLATTMVPHDTISAVGSLAHPSYCLCRCDLPLGSVRGPRHDLECLAKRVASVRRSPVASGAVQRQAENCHLCKGGGKFVDHQ